jgi:hypothetical protein
MDTRWGMVWTFLLGAVVSGVLTLPLMMRPGVVSDVAWSYLRDVGTVYAGPLGIMVPALLTRRTPFSAISRQQGAFALVVTVLWNIVPVGIGLYGAFAPHIDQLETILKNFNSAAIPLNAVLVAILAALFPKAEKPAAGAPG